MLVVSLTLFSAVSCVLIGRLYIMEQDVFPGCTPPSIFSASRIILRKTSTAVWGRDRDTPTGQCHKPQSHTHWSSGASLALGTTQRHCCFYGHLAILFAFMIWSRQVDILNIQHRYGTKYIWHKMDTIFKSLLYILSLCWMKMIKI